MRGIKLYTVEHVTRSGPPEYRRTLVFARSSTQALKRVAYYYSDTSQGSGFAAYFDETWRVVGIV